VGYASNVTDHVCEMAERNLLNEFVLVMTSERMPESLALLHKIFFHGAQPTKPEKATLYIHERSTDPDPLREVIIRNDTLRELVYKHSPCDLRMHRIAQQLLNRQLGYFPDLIREVEAQQAEIKKEPPPPVPVREAGLHLGAT
jgi:hypothetical protein